MHWWRWRNYGDPNYLPPKPVTPPCSVEGCETVSKSAGMCGKHYQRQRTHGTTEVEGRERNYGTPMERVMARKTLDPIRGCWIYDGGVGSNGYPTVNVNRVTRTVHKFIYTSMVGNVPEGMYLDHICRERKCFNPEHLRVVTTKQNGENLSGERSNNTSGYRGVNWLKSAECWVTRVGHNYKSYSVGQTFPLYELHVAAYYVRKLRAELHTHNEDDRN